MRIDIQKAEHATVGNMREISRLTRPLTSKRTAICINPSKTRDRSQIVTESQLLIIIIIQHLFLRHIYLVIREGGGTVSRR